MDLDTMMNVSIHVTRVKGRYNKTYLMDFLPRPQRRSQCLCGRTIRQ